MCTLAVWREADGAAYRLWFNRDEKHARSAETPPRAGLSPAGVRHVSPRDGERGGTWLLLNQHGLTLCVLNDYEAGGAEPGQRSRGELPLLAADAADAETALAAVLRAGPPEAFAPYKFVAVDPAGQARVLHWDGRSLRRRDLVEFETSSSFASAEVRRSREAAHAALSSPGAAGRSEHALERLHWSHDPAAGAWSVRMRRADACTRSVCTVHARRVGGAVEASLLYTAVDWSRADGRGPRVEVSP